MSDPRLASTQADVARASARVRTGYRARRGRHRPTYEDTPGGHGGAYVHRLPAVAVIVFGATAVVALGFWTGLGAASAYGYAVFAILGTKLALSLLPARTYEPQVPPHRVGVVITSYNEDPAYLRACLDSLIAQDQTPTKLVIVDDCSTETAGYELAREYAGRYAWIDAIRHDVNKGKREALASGFRDMAEYVDIFMAVDSDTILEPQALSQGTRPFTDPNVTAVSGVMLVTNYATNVLTRLIDVRFVNAFLGERAAYSRLGSVLCVCGALAYYRADVTMRHLDAFLNQTFRGQRATVGDDRHMTNLCLTEGKVVLAERSIGHTAVPERLGHYIRQQARWGRSFFRESWWVMANRSPRSVAWWLTLVELAQWLLFTSLVLVALVIYPILTGKFLFWHYVLLLGLMALARSVRYFDVIRPAQPITDRLMSFTTSPLYGYMNLFVMLPLRVWSLLTLSRAGWGTRSTVELTAVGSTASR